jgi:predicted metal-binding membrane protein
MGAGKGGGRGGGSESVKKACITLFFMIFMLGSMLVSSIPLLVTVANISVP